MTENTQSFSEEKYAEDRKGTDLSFGEKAVGLSFNPSNIDDVYKTKRNYANLIDVLDWHRNQTDNPEKKRQLSIAITEAQTSCMWAVKSLTWQY